jgi:sugar/nucleoside kinase (ribokinase family)
MADLDLLVLGDASPDLLLRGGDVTPAFGQTERLVDEGSLTVGGSGAIMACAAVKLGLRTAFAGVVGDDTFGRFMREELVARGVDVRGIRVDPHRPTGVTVVLSRGEDVSSYFLQDALRQDLSSLLDEVRRNGASTSIDPNWDPAERWNGDLLNLLSLTDLFLPNSAEARAITGIDDIDVAAESLATRGGTVAVKFGDGGGMVVRGEVATRVAGIKVSVVDTTGAGDTFDAGFIAGHLSGWPAERCLALANVCGGLSTRAAGGVAAQPTLEEAMDRIGEVEGRPSPP